MDKFHWTALDKEKSDGGLLSKLKLLTWKSGICVNIVYKYNIYMVMFSYPCRVLVILHDFVTNNIS